MRKITAVTVGRSDYGILLPILKKLNSDHEIELLIIAAGMHLAPEFGLTYKYIIDDGFEISDYVEMLLSSNTSQGVAMSMGLGVIGFSQVYYRQQPDMLLLVGDRFEMHSAASAAQPFNIPIAHIHGGEITEGAIDDSFRHSITKMSHIHFVSTEEYRDRVIQMGEEPWRVIISGAPSLDNLYEVDLLSLDDLESELGVSLTAGCLLVTYHPVTLEYDQTEFQMIELLAALENIHKPIIFTKPNADAGGQLITRLVTQFVESTDQAYLFDNLGTQRYFSLMRYSSVMVGNSSSGIIEAASFGLPVINIGSRQDGRVKAWNVIDVGNTRQEIIEGIDKGLKSKLSKSKDQFSVNPYRNGVASDVIVRRLQSIELGDQLLRKKFYDV